MGTSDNGPDQIGRGRDRRRPTGQPQGGPRPEHPDKAATLLVIGVTLFIFLVAVVSTFGGR